MRNPITAPTVRELFLQPSGTQDARYDAFFAHVRLPNGTFKTTNSQRQTDVDDALCAQLSADRHRRILDLAVSSGSGTAELSERLTQCGIRHSIFGSDRYLSADCMRLWPVTILASEDQFTYQVDVGNFAFPNTPPSKLSGVLFAIARLLLRVRRCFSTKPRLVRMLSKRALDSNVVFAHGDIFGEIIPAVHGSQFDVIRASNILNLAYFSRDQICAAITNIAGYLSERGLFIVCRTDESTNRFTIFQRSGDRFAVVAQGGGGSEIEEIVTALRFNA